jgi:hypothetical protein
MGRLAAGAVRAAHAPDKTIYGILCCHQIEYHFAALKAGYLYIDFLGEYAPAIDQLWICHLSPYVINVAENYHAWICAITLDRLSSKTPPASCGHRSRPTWLVTFIAKW